MSYLGGKTEQDVFMSWGYGFKHLIHPDDEEKTLCGRYPSGEREPTYWRFDEIAATSRCRRCQAIAKSHE